MSLRVVAAGPGLSIQDAGRAGYLRYGVSESGPMDWAAHELANRLVGNAPGAAALEIGPGGARFAAQAAVAVAVAGTGFQVKVDGEGYAVPVAAALAEGQEIEVRPGRAGMWAYLALGGGIDAPEVLGSAAYHARAGLGHRLEAGDILNPRAQGSLPFGLASYADPLEGLPAGPLGVVAGPQEQMFSDEMKARLTEAKWRVSPRADRMGYCLDGPQLAAQRGSDIVSEGIVMGSIQVPGNGQPIVLMADRQPTGGYSKIGVVCRADVRRLAQTRPCEAVSFAWITVEEAVARLRRVREMLNAPSRLLAEAPSAERLLRANLISGVTGADPD